MILGGPGIWLSISTTYLASTRAQVGSTVPQGKICFLVLQRIKSKVHWLRRPQAEESSWQGNNNLPLGPQVFLNIYLFIVVLRLEPRAFALSCISRPLPTFQKFCWDGVSLRYPAWAQTRGLSAAASLECWDYWPTYPFTPSFLIFFFKLLYLISIWKLVFLPKRFSQKSSSRLHNNEFWFLSFIQWTFISWVLAGVMGSLLLGEWRC